MIEETTEDKRPIFTQCSVCKAIAVNGCGSTACCGGFHEHLYADEVEALGIPASSTKNENTVRCTCKKPQIHTDEHGINYCKKCKVKVALLSPPKK